MAFTLTIAVPTFNMDWCLEKNLNTYDDYRLSGRLEVLCLNNASEDRSKEIIESFAERRPEIFKLIDRDNRGYGSSVNAAIRTAQGRYFRIVDADDWVDTESLVRLVELLETNESDIVVTDYQLVNMQTGEHTPVRAGDMGVEYGRISSSMEHPMKTEPSIHCLTYRTDLLRESGFYMQDNIFFVDEEYIVLPFLYAKNIQYLDLDVYRYLVGNPNQSTSNEKRAKLQYHKEQVIRRLIGEYQRVSRENPENQTLPYLKLRTGKLIGDHFTTLLIYVQDRTEGRRLAKEWESYVRREVPELWKRVKRKAMILYSLNALHVSLPAYLRLKKLLLKK